MAKLSRGPYPHSYLQARVLQNHISQLHLLETQ